MQITRELGRPSSMQVMWNGGGTGAGDRLLANLLERGDAAGDEVPMGGGGDAAADDCDHNSGAELGLCEKKTGAAGSAGAGEVLLGKGGIGCFSRCTTAETMVGVV